MLKTIRKRTVSKTTLSLTSRFWRQRSAMLRAFGESGSYRKLWISVRIVRIFSKMSAVLRFVSVPDTASYIRGWIEMVLAPNDLFSWNNKYNKYIEYNITDTFTCFFLAMHTTYSVHAGILKPWRGRLPRLPAVFSFYHVLSLPLSGLNWRSLFLPRGSDPPFPKMAPPFTGSAHTPLPGSRTVSERCKKSLKTEYENLVHVYL